MTTHTRRSQGSQKQTESAVYNAGQGKLLFVPLESMRTFRDTACRLKAKGIEPTIATVAKESDQDRHTLESRVGHWRRKLLGAFDWFNGWLLGNPMPSNVSVATVEAIQRCRQAWDYRRILAEAGIPDITYQRWLRSRKFTPDLVWLKWLFGGKHPQGYFRLDNKLQQLRAESTKTAILRAADLDEGNLREWLKDTDLRNALKTALRIARKRTHEGEFRRVCPALHARTAKNMWAYAMAARLRERCKRAGISGTKQYWGLLSEAGPARADVERFLKAQGIHQPAFPSVVAW